MRLTDIVVKEAILTELDASSKEEAIRQMVGGLKAAGKISAGDEEAILAAILKREELGSTGIGWGCAVPHTKHPSVDGILVNVALHPQGLDFQSLDGEDVFILFLVISPWDRPGDHLRGLETITRHLKSEDFRSFLRQSKTAADVWELLQEVDDRS
ncbi:MAG: PTS sugar transporter subunit IIA [Planctomycetaceae bacterium]|nr:PTS sugar transporter subunit IIA [Planctomycetaceae bacterium]MCA9032202.1 PTS sugar transporter subunit IIA [Planctomycetaceae bacterium]MCB9950127.1 PTS sugar transporter subunit IIA [Planctomycetaceae bacterium]